MLLKGWKRIVILAIFLVLVSGTANAAVSINELNLSGKTIVIDPGHTSTQSDRVASGEYEINHKIGLMLQELLVKDGATVYLTDVMGDAEEPTIGERASFVKSKNPDMFISIHTNAGPSSARGVEVWLWSANDKPEFRERELAELLYNNVIKQTQQPSTRGIKEKNNPWDGSSPNDHIGVPIISDYTYPCPAVLVELDFTTYSSPVSFNGKTYSNMRELMKSPEYQSSAAEALHNSIRDYFFKKLDLIFLIDTTGSMWDDISSVKSSATEIVEALDSKDCDYRVSVADYRDYPMYPYGQPGLDYVYKLDLPFSNDKNTIVNSINSLSLGDGADWQESVYSALVNAIKDSNKDLSNQDNYGWRKGVTKCIILIGDAPSHVPEPWSGGQSLDDVVYWSEHVDPVAVYSIRVGYDSSTYTEFSEISERTGGKVYTSDNAADLVDTIIEVIGDIGEPIESDRGVSVNIDPTVNVANPGGSVTYSISVTNTGTIADTYDMSIDLQNFASEYRGYPTAIQTSWANLDTTSVEIEPSDTKTLSLTVTVPNDWAGMEDVVYPFEVTAKSETDESVSNTSSAELKVIANKKSMIEYSKLETIWLSELVESSSINDEIKNSLLEKLTNSTVKLDQSILNMETGKDKQANNMLGASQNIINAFVNQVEAQYDKKIMQPDAEVLIEKANTILEDIEFAKNA